MSPEAFHEEDRVAHAGDMRHAARLLKYIRPRWKLVVLSSVVSSLIAALSLAGPYIVKVTIDNHIAKGDYAGVARLSGLFIGTIAGLFVLEYVQAFLIAWVGQQGMFDLRRELFAHVQKMSLAFFDRNPVGRLMTRVTSDVATLNELFAQGVMTLAGDIFLLAGITILMLKTDVRLTLLVFITVPIMLVAGKWFRTAVRESSRDARTRLSRMNAYIQENLGGIRTVQAYNRERRNRRRFVELNSDFREANMRTVAAYAFFVPAIEVIGALALALIIWYGGVRALSGGLTVGVIYLFIQYIQRFFQPIKDLSDKFNIFQTALASAERIFNLLDTPAEISSPEKPEPFTGLKDEIRFENVSFAYKDEDWVLRDVSFTVRRGESVALVGSTGSGKTTVTSLLTRFYDVQKGAIKVDGTDIRRLDLSDWRRQFAVVLQDVFLFSGDIASNIRLGNEAVTDEVVERAGRNVNANEFIAALPGGYKQEVLERGATLSVGQKQLLAFARALAFDPAILILDEATASIDTETEHLIQDALQKLLKGRTSIVIAHRLSTIQNADRIIVMHHGKIREVGTHQELLRRDGIYRKLYELQYRDVRVGKYDEGKDAPPAEDDEIVQQSPLEAVEGGEPTDPAMRTLQSD
ncbi:antibiotic ABC transporter ATP-binding protein [candidate division BRC1 bacterium HGW-BRC1-1]|jgi:ATP-binding cassette subfamily B protein|nr:MAG: antibiotic ABC transporter ATP-binding protein [candidate division BRC1 bacterium HGW-BRC1-1]